MHTFEFNDGYRVHGDGDDSRALRKYIDGLERKSADSGVIIHLNAGDILKVTCPDMTAVQRSYDLDNWVDVQHFSHRVTIVYEADETCGLTCGLRFRELPKDDE